MTERGKHIRPIQPKQNITLYNADNIDVMAQIEDDSVDAILTDPPYLYLKGQKIDRQFDEQLFFSECKRVLSKNGFIILFGRGSSFYRWNTILDELGLNFKEEIIWDKSYCTSPLLDLSRVHETISIHCKGKGKINKAKVPYLEMRKHNIDSIIQDIKRLRSVFTQAKSMKSVLEFLENNLNNDTIVRVDLTDKTQKYLVGESYSVKNFNRCVDVVQSMEFGMNEKSIIKEARNHYGAIHPTEKPVRLLERLLALAVPKDKPREQITILDPFGGSFSTMEAVYNMGMKGISCEIDEEYFAVGLDRVKSLEERQFTLFD